MAKSTLFVIYDLASYPPQFDFITFMTQAKTAAQGHPLHVFFSPTEDGGYVRPDKVSVDGVHYSKDEAEYRLIHICLPACALFDATHTVLPNRETAWALDGEWLIGINHVHAGIMRVWNTYGKLRGPKATKRSRELVSRYLLRFSKPIVTITVRNSFRNKVKNSNLEAWFEFADRITDRFQPIFLPDTENAFDEWSMLFPAFSIGAVDLDSRLALYEMSHMNCFTSNGPAAMCMWNELPLLWFSQNLEQIMTKETMETHVCKFGEQPPYLNSRQKFVWDTDKIEVISAAFEEIA